MLLGAATALAAERHMMPPRVPTEHLAEARALHSPLSPSSDVVERGRSVYHGKGGCVNCHGASGSGDGPAAMGLDPSPRNFHHHGFWRHRTEGELFWVIKHGSQGTSMIGFAGMLSDDEIWTVIEYLRHLAGDGQDGAPGMGRHGTGRMGAGESNCCGQEGR
jgi:mono/diheme cytochrome c family protein